MNEWRSVLEHVGRVMAIPGVLAVSVVDAETGESLGSLGCAVGNGTAWAEAGRSALLSGGAILDALEAGEDLEELVICGSRRFHLLRITPRRAGEQSAVIHIALDRIRANLAMARLELKALAESLCLQAPPVPSAGRAPPLPKRIPDRTRDLRLPSRPPGLDGRSPEHMIWHRAEEPDIATIRRVADALRKLQ